MGTLLYLTDRWPYHPGESFLGLDIRDLAPHFEKIYLLPLSENVDDEQGLRDVPENVVVLSNLRMKIWNKWNKMGKISRLCSGLMKPLMIIGECLKSNPFWNQQGEAHRMMPVLIQSCNFRDFYDFNGIYAPKILESTKPDIIRCSLPY